MSVASFMNIKLMRNQLSSFSFTHKHLLACGYFILLLVPFVIAESLGMLSEGIYNNVLSLLNLLAMMAFFVQFPLAGRLKNIPLFSNVDWGMTKHKQFGKYLGIFFFLHPLLILAPKILLSFTDIEISIVSVITSPQLLTGLIAWAVMVIWVLMSIYKDQLTIRYETWRLIHVIGFAVIATLATFHITSVGSHGQYDQAFNLMWWSLYSLSMALVIYNYFIKPRFIRNQPFVVNSINKVSDCDWELTIESTTKKRFAFEPGQFAWINSSHSAFNLEQHPFSIVSHQDNHSQLSFLIRELGDYTKKLGQLEIGQKVYVDGPYGSMTLAQSIKAPGITLIAGGAGIAPMLSLLNGFIKQNEIRPIRLIYSNIHLQRMVGLTELMMMQDQLADFQLQLLCEQVDNCSDALTPYVVQGRIGKEHIMKTINTDQEKEWAIYLSGPEGMINATVNNLKQLGLPANHIHFEQLSF